MFELLIELMLLSELKVKVSIQECRTIEIGLRINSGNFQKN